MLLKGHFIYLQVYIAKDMFNAQVFGKPEKQNLFVVISRKVRNTFKEIDLILSPAIGGIVVGYEIGRILNIETIFAERANNLFLLRRGFNIKGKNFNCEDVITTGKSCIECSELAKKFGGEILGYACIIDK